MLLAASILVTVQYVHGTVPTSNSSANRHYMHGVTSRYVKLQYRKRNYSNEIQLIVHVYNTGHIELFYLDT